MDEPQSLQGLVERPRPLVWHAPACLRDPQKLPFARRVRLLGSESLRFCSVAFGKVSGALYGQEHRPQQVLPPHVVGIDPIETREPCLRLGLKALQPVSQDPLPGRREVVTGEEDTAAGVCPAGAYGLGGNVCRTGVHPGVVEGPSLPGVQDLLGFRHLVRGDHEGVLRPSR